MTPITLTPDQIELLLVLCQINRDILERRIVQSLSPQATGGENRVPDTLDMKMAQELELTRATIRVLEGAK